MLGGLLSLALCKGFCCGPKSCSTETRGRNCHSSFHEASDAAAVRVGSLLRRQALLGDQILAMFESVMEVAMHMVMVPLISSLSVPPAVRNGGNLRHVMGLGSSAIRGYVMAEYTLETRGRGDFVLNQMRRNTAFNSVSKKVGALRGDHATHCLS